MAEDHGLCDGNGPIDVTESLELLLLAVTDYIVLLDGVQCLLFTFQLDDVGVRDDALIQHKHIDFLGVDKPELLAPVQDCSRGANHNLLLNTAASSDLSEELPLDWLCSLDYF
uniref:Uncharacterized protein n=1 Tax=Astyanax mexicanus TaxID=7994 RepID=A0A3B1IZ51_ASTMX